MSHTDRCGTCKRRGMRYVCWRSSETVTLNAHNYGLRIGDVICLGCGTVTHPPPRKAPPVPDPERVAVSV